MDHDVLERTLEGVTHEESLRQPEPQGNCLNWVLGHIVATRDRALSLLGEPGLLTEEQFRPYARGSAPLRDASRARRVEELREDLERKRPLALGNQIHLSLFIPAGQR